MQKGFLEGTLLERDGNDELVIILRFARRIVFSEDKATGCCCGRRKGKDDAKWDEVRGHPVALRLGRTLKEKEIIRIAKFYRKARFKVPISTCFSGESEWTLDELSIRNISDLNKILLSFLLI